jgi:hemerythrin
MSQNALFQWTPDLAVNIAEIDNQHKMLVNILNQLFVAVAERKSNQIIGEILDALLDYAATHFALEENLMRSAGYGGSEFDEHLKSHQVFIEKMNSVAHKARVENKMVSFELMNFLKHWLKDHICETDRKYAEALHRAGFSTTQWENQASEAISVKAPTNTAWWKFW